MTQEDKQLLIKDLAARLPYDVKLHGPNEADDTIWTLDYDSNISVLVYVGWRPYLRPMSSMTDEEIDRMWKIYDSGPAAESSVAVAEYLYERHLDCHYLIEKGLALEAPEGMYKIE